MIQCLGCGAWVTKCPHVLLRLSEDGKVRIACPGRNMDKGLSASQSPDGGMEFSWNPVPFERYRYPVTIYYSDNFRFAEEKGEYRHGRH